MNRIFFFIYTCCVLFNLSLLSQTIKIGLYYNNNIESSIISIVHGEYKLIADSKEISHVQLNDIFHISIENQKIRLTTSQKIIGFFNTIQLIALNSNCCFQLRPTLPILKSNDYEDNLILKASRNSIVLINDINIEKYICGVLEVEGGSQADSEFYKAQAILARTYAFKNFYRHAASGYNLCSTIHCQAYKGKSYRNNHIQIAVEATNGLVIVDENLNLVTTPYHANCGGQTDGGKNAWQKNLIHLQSIIDPFCEMGQNYNWEKRMSIQQWVDYLNQNGIKISVTSINNSLVSSEHRHKNLKINNQEILFRKIREDWKLNSSFINILREGNTIIFKGRGYGHGAGMCQQGAIQMAKVGYTYIDILHFYFRNVNIVDYQRITTSNQNEIQE